MKQTGFEYLGTPYWEWTEHEQVPDIFDNMDFPSAVDRMMDIKHGHQRRGTFMRQDPPVTRNADEWRFSFNRAQVQRVNSRDGNLEYQNHLGNWRGISDYLEDASRCQRGFRRTNNANINTTLLKDKVKAALEVVEDFEKFLDDLDNPHGIVHNKVDCLMPYTKISAYDPGQVINSILFC